MVRNNDATTACSTSAKHRVKQIRNPNIEIRNKVKDRINLKSKKTKTPNPKESRLEFCLWLFEILSTFGFRASNFPTD